MYHPPGYKSGPWPMPAVHDAAEVNQTQQLHPQRRALCPCSPPPTPPLAAAVLPNPDLPYRPSPLPPPRAAAVLPILTSYAPRLAAPYLEAALASCTADPATHEQELAMLYLQVGGLEAEGMGVGRKLGGGGHALSAGRLDLFWGGGSRLDPSAWAAGSLGGV